MSKRKGGSRSVACTMTRHPRPGTGGRGEGDIRGELLGVEDPHLFLHSPHPHRHHLLPPLTIHLQKLMVLQTHTHTVAAWQGGVSDDTYQQSINPRSCFRSLLHTTHTHTHTHTHTLSRGRDWWEEGGRNWWEGPVGGVE